MSVRENTNFERYIELRIRIRDSHNLQWEFLNKKILILIQKTEDVTPEIVDDIKKAYDYLSQAIIASVFPADFSPPKNYNDLQEKELPLLSSIPEALRKMFNKLFKAYLKNSLTNSLTPDDTLYNLLTKFNNENAELRYRNSDKNPYLNPRFLKYGNDWRRKAADEFYPYYDGVLTFLSSVRNFETHKEDAFTSTQFELTRRKVADPISGIESPANYLVLCNIVILSVYTFIEIMQIWIDTQVRRRNEGGLYK